MKAGARICMLVALAMAPGIGRLEAQPRPLAELVPRLKVENALADVVGRAVVQQLARRIRENADAHCLKSRHLTPAALQRQARTMLASYGAKLMALQARRVTEEALAAALDELAWPGASTELRALAASKRIRRLQAYYRPRLNDDLVDRITAALDHYAVIHRIPIGRLNAINLGTIELAVVAAARAASADEAAQKSFGGNPRLRRLAELYRKLLEAHEQVLISSSDDRPNFSAFTGIEERFRALCLRVAV